MLSALPTVIKTDFDSLLAKIIITADTWTAAVAKAKRALADTRIDGVKTSLDALRGIINSPAFVQQKCDTQWLEEHSSNILASGRTISAESFERTLLKDIASTPPLAISSSAANTLFRKGDAWSMTLAPEGEAAKSASPGHLKLTRVLRNEFPQSLAASVLYTSPEGTSHAYEMSMTSTSASAGATASKHRRGDVKNFNHIIIPVPGQLMEVSDTTLAFSIC